MCEYNIRACYLWASAEIPLCWFALVGWESGLVVFSTNATSESFDHVLQELSLFPCSSLSFPEYPGQQGLLSCMQ